MLRAGRCTLVILTLLLPLRNLADDRPQVQMLRTRRHSGALISALTCHPRVDTRLSSGVLEWLTLTHA